MSRREQCSAFVPTLVALAFVLAGPGFARATADPQPKATVEKPEEPRSEPKAAEPGTPPPKAESEIPVYKPPKPARGSFPRDLTGAATRGGGGADAPLVLALAPDHLGLTVNEQPNLYWFLESDSAIRVDFTLIDEESVNPLLEITMAGPMHGGIHTVRLADHGLSLAPGRWYEWSVAVVAGGRNPSEDRISRGFITRIEMPGDVAQRLETRGAEQAVNVLAESGLWYDAITALSEGIETREDKTRLRRARAALLDQVGLTPVASYDRDGTE